MDPTPKIKPQSTTEQKRELTPEEKKTAQLLENLSFLENKYKIFLVLIWRKLKSASQISLWGDIPISSIGEFEEAMQQAGLFYKFSQTVTPEDQEPKQRRLYFVANNQQDLDLISEIWFRDHINDPKVYREMGRMSGYPPTAIDTFDKFTRLPEPEREKRKQELVLTEEEKKKLFPADIYPFSLSFFMSKAHWKIELETVIKWAEEIKLFTPGLYKSCINELNGRKKSTL